MILKHLHIDGFGVWSDLRLDDFGDGLTLLYGENETGKTTLLEFVRSVLYGFNDERRAKYLPPVHGGTGGGTLTVEAAAGKFHVRRRADGAESLGRLDLTNLSGTAQDVRLIRKITGDLDEATFTNVFALGLGEIQELGTLSGGGAAEFLYDLAIGSGGVSLTEVQRELGNARRRLLSSERDAQVGQLLERRTQLLADVETHRQVGRNYVLLCDERRRLADDVRRCEVEGEEARDAAELFEAAVTLHEPWQRRNATAAESAALGTPAPIPAEVWQKLAQMRERYGELRPTFDQLKQQRSEVRRRATEAPLNKILWRQGPRIEVLAAQLGWIEQLEENVRRLEAAAPTASPRRESLPGELVKLGLSTTTAEKLGDRRLLKNLQRLHAERTECERRLATAAELDARLHERMETTDEASSRTSRHVSSNDDALEAKSRTVAALRKRTQIEQKIEQLTEHAAELERRLRELVVGSDAPKDLLLNLNAAFVAGCLMFFTGLVVHGPLFGLVPNWLLIVVGAAVAFTAGGKKVLGDLATNEQLAALRNQRAALESQQRELEKERDALDAEIPTDEGTLAARLHRAERELTEHEERTAADDRRSAAHDEWESARIELRTAEELAEQMRRRWQHELEQAGLPAKISWEQLRTAARSRRRVAVEQRRAARRTAKLDRLRSELALLADRTAQACAEAQLEPQGERVSDQLRALHAAWQRNEERRECRRDLHREFRALDRRLRTTAKELTVLGRRRKKLLRSLGVASEKQLQRRHERLQRRAELLEKHEALDREIAAGLGQKHTLDDLRTKLETFELPQLEQRWMELGERSRAIEARLKELYAEQGRLEEKLAAAAADTGLARTLYELNTIERRMEETLERWQTLSVAARLVEALRKKYEAERQPETLREASRYFERLTEGKYRRVWTPLEKGILYVDTADGETLPVGLLSRGSREQLFLALRLALVDLFARRGKALPLVLDDVLVNFDTRRTRIAAELLCDFAVEHRQVLLFTCHEHIYHLFKNLRADARLLPGQTIAADAGPVRTIEKIVEKIVRVKEPVYVPAAVAAPNPPPPLPWLDGTGVFHLPPPKPKIAVIAAPESIASEPEDVIEVEETEPTTVVRTERVGLPVVPFWNPATPFAEAAWQGVAGEQPRDGDRRRPTQSAG